MTGRATRALLLTGHPGVGKTTVIRRVVAGLGAWRARGFTTEEIRVGGRRTGFRLETLDGRRETLARVDPRTPHRVGSYGADGDAREPRGTAGGGPGLGRARLET